MGEFSFVLEGQIYFFSPGLRILLFLQRDFSLLEGEWRFSFFERFFIPVFREIVAGWGCGVHIGSKNMLYTV